jgi:sugar lactone lactonase YvrE
MLKPILAILLLGVLTPPSAPAQTLDSTRLFDFFRLYNQAAGAQDYVLAKRYLDTAMILSPDFSQLRAAHVRASLRAGLDDEALAGLERMAAQRLVAIRASLGDSLVQARLGQHARFAQLQNALKALDRLQGQFKRFTQLPDAMTVPEGTAYDAKTKTLFVSSIYQRKILAIDASGRVRDFVAGKDHGLLSVIGLAVDEKRRVLYACSSFNPRNTIVDTADAADRHTAVYAYDLATAKLLKKYTHGEAVFFNDLAIDGNGDVYVTDSDGNTVYRLRPTAGTIEPYLKQPVLYSPNGIALDERRRHLYVGAFLGGILRHDLATGRSQWLTKPDSISLAGTDGLEIYENTLIVNSPLEHRAVRRLHLNSDRTAVVREEILAYDPAQIAETTTGALAGGRFYFIANSGLDAYEPNGSLNATKLRPAVILQCELK